MTSKIFCVLSNDTNLTGFHVDFEVSLTVSDLKDAIRAKKDIPGSAELTLVRICKADVGGLTADELERFRDLLLLATYGESPERTNDVDSTFCTAPGACVTKDGLTFKVMNSMKKVSFFTASLPEEVYHVLVLVPPVSQMLVPRVSRMLSFPALSTSAGVQIRKVIAIYSSLPDTLVISTLCGIFDVSKYTLKHKVNKVLVDLSLDSILILPGDYIFEPNIGCEDLKIQGEAFPITPTSKLKRKFNPGSPLTSLAKKTRVDTLASDDNESFASSESNNRSTKFREIILTRDNHCVVTRDYGSVEAAHILAHSWWNDVPGRRDKLPVEIRNIILSLDGGIDNVSNGILLTPTLACAFDEGKFSFEFRDGHFYVIAITTEFLKLDGTPMDENLRERSDGTCWWSVENQPDSRLVDFHFRNSVFKHMKGSAWTEEDSDSEYDRDEVFSGKQRLDSQHLVVDWITE
ncbi:hypothetical protein HDU84_000556, partial [Entophlyctis sp. JEL0112]